MTIKDIHSVYPISWILKSVFLVDFVKASLNREDGEMIVADFASGEHDRVPSFFIDFLPDILNLDNSIANSVFVYCIDIHALRLDSLLGNLEELGLLAKARVVQARLETMDEQATLRPSIIDYLNENTDHKIWLDQSLIDEKRLPSDCFDLGVLNNDIIGYMAEYYTEYSDVLKGLSNIHKTMKKDGIIVVTMPCSLYVVDNISLLHNAGFDYVEGMDIDIHTGMSSIIKAEAEPYSMSRLGHYSFLIFNKK
jgi:hypothetical protein